MCWQKEEFLNVKSVIGTARLYSDTAKLLACI